ncbi:uncharacterized protein LOC144438541 [Glandiceps talaboti]
MLRIKVGSKMVGLKQLSPDDIAAMRRMKSSEMSTWVQCNNHAHAIHTKKKVDLWYKEQNINVGKLGRRQQGMYQALLKVHLEKRRIRKKKYIHQQELVQQELREKAAKEKHETTLKMKGLKKSKATKKDLPEVLSDIGEEEEEEGKGGDPESKKIDAKGNNSMAENTVGSSVKQDSTKQAQNDGKEPVFLEVSQEKQSSKKPLRKLGIAGQRDNETKPLTGVSKVESTPSDIDISESIDTTISTSESSRQNGEDSKPESNEIHDNIIDVVSEANKDPISPDTKDTDNRRREKKVKEPVGMLPRVSLTTSYLTHGAPRESEVQVEDEPDRSLDSQDKGSGKTRKKSRKTLDSDNKSTSNTPDKLPEITSRRSSEVSKGKQSSIDGPITRKLKPDTMIDITRFTRFTQTVRIPSNVHIPRISNVIRYHRNSRGSLVPSEVSLRPVEEDYKLPSTRQSYLIKKALKEEKEKTKASEKKLQDFYTKMETEVPNRLPVMDHPIHSPSKEMFSDGHDGQQKVAFSASLLAQLRHNTVEGDVNDMKNCKYIRFYDMMTPEQREVFRRRRESSWGKHGLPDPNSWKARTPGTTGNPKLPPVDLK